MTYGTGSFGLLPFAVPPASSGGEPAPESATVAGLATMAWAATGAVDAEVLPLPSGSISISSPVPYRLRQRNVGANTASVTIAGTSTATSAIEYRRGTGAWQTLVASHPGGAYSVAVTLSTGQGDLQVRHASDNAVTASVALATVGDAFIAIGQSNNVGVSPEVVAPVASAFTALQYDRADTWKPLQEGSTQATSFDGGSTGSKGSYFGALSNRLQANNVPVAFIPAAVGSTTIADWQRYAPLPTALSTLYGRALTQWNEMGGGRAAILWQGESDASSGTTKAAYKAGLHAVIDGWWTDTGTPVFLVLITNFHANAPMIREAQMEVIAESAHVIGWADGGGAYTGDVHYLTAAQINAVADAIYTPFAAAFYTEPAAADVAGLATMAWSATGAVDAVLGPAPMSGSVAGLATMAWSATASVSVDLVDLPPDTITTTVAGLATMAWTATGGVTATVLPPPVEATVQGLATMAWSAFGSVHVSDGSIIWPTTRAGEAATARVPFDGVRVIVPDADDPAAPVKALPLYLVDTERVLFDFDAKYLPGAGDTAATLLAVDAPAGLLATPDLPVGSALTSGVVALAITPATTAGTYRLQVQIRTTGGRECTGLLDVVVSASVQPVKTFRLRSTADRDVFELDYTAKYLAGAADEAASLLGVTADAGLSADARLDVGGVVQLAVDNPAAAGTYQVQAQLLTTAGRRKTGAIAVEVLP